MTYTTDPKFKGLAWLRDHVEFAGQECLTWPFSCSRGYAQVPIGDGLVRKAARVMCELVNGPPPSSNYEAAHSCGRGDQGCVHPKHVSWKTRAQNQLDRRKHGTTGNGGYGRRSRLKPDQVLAIRSSADSGEALATRHGITRSAVRKIRTGEIWAKGPWPVTQSR